MIYENSEQLDRALKKAVRSRDGNPGDGYRQALRDNGEATRRLAVVENEGPGRRGLLRNE